MAFVVADSFSLELDMVGTARWRLGISFDRSNLVSVVTSGTLLLFLIENKGLLQAAEANVAGWDEAPLVPYVLAVAYVL